MTQKNIIKKLAEIMADVGRIPKNGYNSFHKYNYATESDVQDAVRDHMSKKGLMMIPNITDSTIREVTTRKGATEYIYRVQIEYTLIDAESGETLTFTMEGEGQDAGDKAIYKAISGAQKYAIMKLFLIPTGDDPERDGADNVESRPTSKGQPAGSNQAKNKKEDDKKFFEARDAVKKRIADLALQRQTSEKEITDYLVTKSNKVLNKGYKSINSINMDTIVRILTALEQKPAQPNNGQQGEMLDRFTNQPQ